MFKTIALLFVLAVAIDAMSLDYPTPRFEVEKLFTPSGQGFFVFAHNDNGALPAMSRFSFKRDLPQDMKLEDNYDVEDLDTGKHLDVTDGGFSVEVPVRGVKVYRLTPAQ